MAAGISDISHVKAMTQTFSVWLPVISTLAGGVLAGGVAILVTRQFPNEMQQTIMRYAASRYSKNTSFGELYSRRQFPNEMQQGLRQGQYGYFIRT